jgi:hypothetical protein
MGYMNKGIIYYTNNRIEERITIVCRKVLLKACNGIPIASVSHFPIDFGTNIVVDLPSCSKSVFKQILIGLENCNADVIYLCEHDVLYHSSHFDYIPKYHRFYYNQNRWSVDSYTGDALYRRTKAMSCLVSYKEILIDHFTNLLNLISKDGYKRSVMGFSPGTHRFNGMKIHGVRMFESEYPNIDIRHNNNISGGSFNRNDFDDRESRDWILTSEVPGWGKTKDRFDEFIKKLGQ